MTCKLHGGLLCLRGNPERGLSNHHPTIPRMFESAWEFFGIHTLRNARLPGTLLLKMGLDTAHRRGTSNVVPQPLMEDFSVPSHFPTLQLKLKFFLFKKKGGVGMSTNALW